jgi:hypothetical protein
VNVTKAITIRPPWSQIIAETEALTALGVAPKNVENRGRPIADKHIGTDIAIHAGQTWCPIGGADPRVQRAWWTFANAIGLREPNPLLAAHGDTRTGSVGGLKVPGLWIEQGAVIATATIADCHPAGPCVNLGCHPWGERDYNGGTAWHLVLGNVRRLRTPVPARGAIGVPWTLPDDVAEQVDQQQAVTA